MPVLETASVLSLKNILFATDFSPVSENALPFAAALARQYQSKLLVAHVLPEPQEAVTEHRWSQRDERMRAEAGQRMSEIAAGDSLRGLQHEETLLEGESWKALAQFIADQQVDLAVLGTHGRGGFGELFLGSVAEAVFRHAACPVITVGPRARRPDEQGIQRVLYASDLKGGQHGLPYAVSIANQNNARLIFLHVLLPGGLLPVTVPEEEAEEAKQQMRNLAADSAPLNHEPQFLVEMGQAAREILATAVIHNVDLIVMGVKPGSASAAHAPWAIAHQVVGRAPCPVLTVKN